jgi:putative peptidoglycan lipid II flippase
MSLSNPFRVFNLPSKNLTFSAAILAGSTLLSAFLGIFRDRLLASRFGVGIELDIYAAAFRIPDLVYVFLISGGLAIAFLPLFSEYFSKDEKEGWQMANYILNAFLIFLIFLSGLLFLLSPWLVKILLPGFSSETQSSALNLIRLLLLSPIFFGVANIFSSILQYFNRFFIYALAPVIYNLSIIFGILFLAPNLGILGVGLGVVLGAFLYFLSQFLGAKTCGFSWQANFNFKQPAIRKILALMAPRTLAVTSQQLKLWLITAVASLISTGAISVFYFANNLQGFFVSLVGVSFGTAVFPLLSRAVLQNDGQEFSRHLKPALKQVLLLSLLATLFLLFFSGNLVKFLFKDGRFGETAASQTSQMVILFSLSLFAQASAPLLIRAFFALQEAWLPTIVSIFSLIIEIVFLFLFLKVGWGVLSLALAFSLASIFQFFLLLFFLQKKLKSDQIS